MLAGYSTAKYDLIAAFLPRARHSLVPKAGAQTHRRGIQFHIGVAHALERAVSKVKRRFNVFRTVCDFASDVDAGIFCVPRCRWVDPPSVNNSGNFSGVSPHQGS
jgi:hypothetical protein